MIEESAVAILAQDLCPTGHTETSVGAILIWSGTGGVDAVAHSWAAEEEIFMLTISIPITHPQINQIPST
jgi:hypothetical protein